MSENKKMFMAYAFWHNVSFNEITAFVLPSCNPDEGEKYGWAIRRHFIEN